MPNKKGCSLGTPSFDALPFTEEVLANSPGLPWLVVAIATKRFWCEGAKKKGPCSAGSLAALTGIAQ